MEIQQRWETIQAQISEALKKSGRSAGSVQTVAVTKTQPLEVIEAALSVGITLFGENKVQEGRAKIDVIERGRWHLIGNLQSNKARGRGAAVSFH